MSSFDSPNQPVPPQGPPAAPPPAAPYPPAPPTPPAPPAPAGFVPPPPAPIAAAVPVAKANEPGFTADPSTLAASGLIAAVLFAIGAGLISFLGKPAFGGFRSRLLALTNTVDSGDVALLGVAVALLLLTPDPPGGIPRPILLRVAAAASAVIAGYAIIRALVVIAEDGSVLINFGAFVATIGVGVAAATVGFYAAKESFLKTAAG